MASVKAKLCSTDGTTYGVTADEQGYIYYTTGLTYQLVRVHSKTQEKTILQAKGELRGIVWYKKENVLFICSWKQHNIMAYFIDSQNFCVFAGTSVEGHKDGRLLEAQFSHPWGICIKNDNLYVADKNYARKIDLVQKTVETIAGSGVGNSNFGYQDGIALEAKFKVPSGIQVADDGTVYIIEWSNHMVRKIKDGIVSTLAGKPHVASDTTTEIDYPSSFLLQRDGSFLICDKGHGLRHLTITSAGPHFKPVKEFPAKLFDKQQDKNPRCLCVDHKGVLYVGCSDAIFKVESTWKWERFVWIGKLKEDPNYCLLAILPKELIREICTQLRLYCQVE